MKQLLTIIFTLCLGLAHAQSKPEQAILQIENERYRLMEQADTAKLSMLLSNDLWYCHSNGMVDSKTSLLEGIGSKRLVHNKISTSKETIKIYKRTAIVRGEADYDIVWQGKNMVLHFMYSNVYIKQKGKWLLCNRQTSKIGT